MKRVRTALILASTALLVGCVHGGSLDTTATTIAIETVYRSTHCPSERVDPHGRWIGSPADWQQQWQRLHSNQLRVVPPAPPDVDFATQAILLVHMGQRRTGGYAIELAEPTGRIEEEVAWLSINWVTPPSDAVVTQMITAPCLLLRLQQGDYDSVAVIDQHGREKMRVSIARLE